MAAAMAILRRDLRVELRTHEAIPAMTLLSVAVFVLLHFGLDRDRLEGDQAAGVLWMAMLLAAVLGVSRLYRAEAAGRLDGLRLAPVDRVALFAAKAGVLFAFLVAFEVVALPAYAVLLLGPSIWSALPWLAVVFLAADLCLAVIGALVAAVATATAANELLVPLVLLPLMVPVMIAAAAATEPLLISEPAPAGLVGWIAMLGLYGGVFALIAVAIFDELIEE
jgi:heme exporter protein B